MFQYYFSIFNCFTGVSPPPEILSNQNSRPMESKFFTFVRPYLDYIDSGRFFRQPFCWLYSVLAVLNLLFPLIVLAQSCRLGVFHAGGKVVIAFIIAFLVLALGGWISFQIWWNRKNRIMQSSKQGDDFIAIPVFSDFIQTAGEWAGTWIAVVGGLLSLVLSLILGDEPCARLRFPRLQLYGNRPFPDLRVPDRDRRSCGCRSLPCVGRYCQQYEKVIACRASE